MKSTAGLAVGFCLCGSSGMLGAQPRAQHGLWEMDGGTHHPSHSDVIGGSNSDSNLDLRDHRGMLLVVRLCVS